jgi:hypothetical protein
VENLYDRLLAAAVKLNGRQDLESQLINRVMLDPSLSTDQLEQAIEMAEEVELDASVLDN